MPNYVEIQSLSSVAEKLKMGLAVDPEEFAEVTIYFSGKFFKENASQFCNPIHFVKYFLFTL